MHHLIYKQTGIPDPEVILYSKIYQFNSDSLNSAWYF